MGTGRIGAGAVASLQEKKENNPSPNKIEELKCFIICLYLDETSNI
ncbi:hypothetical protein M096_1731 [Parabacteroides distasonis str. 3999B T(B) 6]|nr:hypothetical protein M096_1731 [Parabacteroides distasonis str. 3999B T(B) 6]